MKPRLPHRSAKGSQGSTGLLEDENDEVKLKVLAKLAGAIPLVIESLRR